MNFKDIVLRIRNRQLELNLTQEKLSELVGITDTYIGAIERATSKCSIETIAKTLNLNLDYMLFGTTTKNIDIHFSEIIKRGNPVNRNPSYSKSILSRTNRKAILLPILGNYSLAFRKFVHAPNLCNKFVCKMFSILEKSV